MLHGCCPHCSAILWRRACAACTAETCHAAFGAGCAPRAMLHAALLGAPAILPGADVGARQDQLHHRVGPPARGGDVQRRLPAVAGRRVSAQLVLTYPARAASTPEPCSADRWLTPSCHAKGFVSPHRRRCKTPTSVREYSCAHQQTCAVRRMQAGCHRQRCKLDRHTLYGCALHATCSVVRWVLHPCFASTMLTSACRLSKALTVLRHPLLAA
jgi:hypothetical protein